MKTDISVSYDDECIDKKPYETMHSTVCRSKTCFQVVTGGFSGPRGRSSEELTGVGVTLLLSDNKGIFFLIFVLIFANQPIP